MILPGVCAYGKGLLNVSLDITSLQVRFSNLPSMQALGDSSTTLGLLFASIGLACFIGPVLSNRITPPRCPHPFCDCLLLQWFHMALQH